MEPLTEATAGRLGIDRTKAYGHTGTQVQQQCQVGGRHRPTWNTVNLDAAAYVSACVNSSVQIRGREEQEKALGALNSRDSLRASAAVRPVVLASSGFAESASPFQSARGQLVGWQKLVRQLVLI